VRLEDRNLLSASPLLISRGAPGGWHVHTPPAAALLAHSDGHGHTFRFGDFAPESALTARAAPAGSAAAEPVRRELVFIDPHVADYQQLVAGLAGGGPGKSVQVVVLDGARDGVDQVSEVLARCRGLDAVHILSHGDPGEVQLGTTWLDTSDLPRYAAEIRGWSRALNKGADVLFYGCDVAASAPGQTLLYRVGRLTGADVAGSTDRTGGAAEGGNWTLEYETGRLHTVVPFTQGALSGWQGVLQSASPVISLDSDAGGSTYNATYYANTAGVAVGDTLDATITDAASTTLASLTVTIQNARDGANEVLSANTTGTLIQASFSGGTLTLSGTDTLANYQRVLRTVLYQDKKTSPNTSVVRNVTLVANDGTNVSSTVTTYVTVSTAARPGSSTAVVSSASPSMYGQAVTFTATVSAVAPASGTPTGTVSFADGTMTLGTAPLSGGKATFTTTALAAGSHSITVSYSGDGTFAPSTSNPLPQAVIPAPLMVRAEDASRVYGQPDPVLTASYSGLVNGDTTASLGGAPSLATTATAASHAGSYAITAGPGTLSDLNYSFTFQNGTLTVTPAPLTVTANAARPYGQPNPPLTATYTGLVNGDTPANLGGTPFLQTGAHVGSPPGSYTLVVGPGTLNDPDYAMTFVNGALTITPAALTVTANDATKVYGQANPAFAASYSGFVNGDTSASLGGALTFTTPATPGSHVGGYSITPGGLTSTNYAITFVNGTLTVTPAPLTVTADDATRVYGQANAAFSASYSGFVNGDTTASLGGAPSLSTTATAASPVGTYAISVGPGTLSDPDYVYTYASGTLTVTPAALTVTVNDATKVYGQANPAFTASYGGLVNGDTPAALGGVLTFATPATAGSGVGTYGVTASGQTSTNYAITFDPGTLTVTPALLTVTADDASKVYGQPNPALTASYNGLVNGDTAASLGGAPSLATPATAASHTGSYAITAGPGTLSDPNYSFTFVNGTLTVTPSPLTVTANDVSKLYGQPNPSLTASYSGLLNGDTPAALGGSPSLNTMATAASAVGSYAITAGPGTLKDPDYSFTFVNGTLTVAPVALTITANDAMKVYGQANPAFAASYSGFVTGDSTASLGGALTFATPANAASHVGGYSITPGGLTSSDYAITFVPGTLTVTPAPLTVAASGASKVYGQPNPAFTASYSGFVNGDSTASLGGAPSLTTTATPASQVGTYAITAGTGTLSDPDYAYTYASGTLTITPAALTVTANDATKVYGQPNPAFSASYSGFVNGDTPASLGGSLTFTTPATAGSGAGTYGVTPAGLTSGNYTITFGGGTLTVTPATLSVTADDASKVYGQPDPALSYTVTGFVNGDTAAVVSGQPTLATAATASSSAGANAITAGPGDLHATNYVFTFQSGTLTITPAPLTVTVNDATKVYGQPNPAFTASYSGFVNGDTTASLGGSPSLITAGSHVGSDAITAGPGTLSDPNYSFTFVNGTLTITPAPLTVIADDLTRAYGQPNPPLTVSYAGLVNGDTPAALGGAPVLQTAAQAGSHPGSYVITAAPGTLSDPDYTFGFANGALAVMPAPLTVTANNVTRAYGQPDPAFTASYTGLVNGDTPASLTGALTFTTAATAASPAGVYGITAGGLTSGDYSLRFAVGSLTVTPTGTPPTILVAPLGQPGVPAAQGPATGNVAPPDAVAALVGASLDNRPRRDSTAGGPSAAGASAASRPSGLPVAPGGNQPAARTVVGTEAARLSGGSLPESAGRPVSAPLFTPLIQQTLLFVSPSTSGGAGWADVPAGESTLTAHPLLPGAAPPELPDSPPPAVLRVVVAEVPWQDAAQVVHDVELLGLPPQAAALVGTGVLASTGYLLLNTRTGVWLLSLLAARPLWKELDPLEVLYAWERDRGYDEEDGETLLSLVE
jgi:hypothetical protein